MDNSEKLEGYVVLGSGMTYSKKRGYLPSLDSRMRLLAATHLYEQARDSSKPWMVVAGGAVYPGHETTLSTIQKQFILRSDKTIPEYELLECDSSFHTLADINDGRDMLRYYGVAKDSIGIISNQYHQVAQRMANDYKMPFVSAESVLLDRYKSSSEATRMIDALDDRYQLTTRSFQNKINQILDLPFGEQLYGMLSLASLYLGRAKMEQHDARGLKNFLYRE